MAENKKSFLLYCDLIHTISKMPNDKAGELFKHILEYVNDENPVTEDLIIQLTFEPIRQQLKRDLVKYEDIKALRSELGKKGAEAKKQKQAIANLAEAKQAVNDNVTVKGKVKDIKNNIEERKLSFSSTLKPFLEKYGKETLNDFYKYWTEPNKSGTKFKMEMEKTWSLELRLGTWASNEGKFGKKEENKQQPTIKIKTL